MPTPIDTTIRTNVTPSSYDFGGTTYKKEARVDGQGNSYTVDIPQAPAPVTTPTSTSTTGATPTTEKTAGQIYDFGSEDPTLTAAIAARDKSVSDIANTPIDENAIRAKKLAEVQAEIDAQNAIYADKLRVAKVQGLGRLGSSTAIQGRRGLIGSDFGNAQTEEVTAANTDIERSIQNELAAKIAALQSGARTNADAEIAAKRAAREAGADKYIEYLKEARTRKESNINKVVESLVAQNLDPRKIDKNTLDSVIPKGYSISPEEIINAYNIQDYTIKKTKADEEAKRKANVADEIAKRGPTVLSEGQSVYERQADGTLKRTAYNPKIFAPKTTTTSSASGYGIDALGRKVTISPLAQTYVDAINNGANMDDIIKGTSKEVQALRGEVIKGLNAQGGQSAKSVGLLEEAKAVADNLINTEAYKSLGGWSTRLGGQFGTDYGDAQAQLAQLSAMLARDNLGLLKGAMSDKDLAFIQSMSTGIEGKGIQSEKYVKERLESIQEKLSKKIEDTGIGQNQSKVPKILISPDGTQQVDTSTLTPEEIKEAGIAGWK